MTHKDQPKAAKQEYFLIHVVVFDEYLPHNNIIFLQMGNQLCCETRDVEYKPTFPQDKEQKIDNLNLANGQASNPSAQQTSIPHKLTPQVKERLEHYKELEQKAEQNQHSRHYGKELYVGQLDEHSKYPEGNGKIYKADGSVYLGEWKQGKAHGNGVYIMKDGSYYEGAFQHNMADGQGKFHSHDFSYEGYFLNNKFHGMGTEKDKVHTFHGHYFEGNKTKGTLSWQDNGLEYEYIGNFDINGLFEGQGSLKEPNGSYEGDFFKGEKHGKGKYSFSNGLKYEGDYSHGKKEGEGTIFNFTGSIAYTGQFHDDIPHGEGYVFDSTGNKLKRRWINGIDAEGIDEA